MSGATKGVQQVMRGNSRFALALGGAAAVTAGFGIFWYAQQANQARKENSPQLGAIPTWEYRLGQEQLPPKGPVQQPIEQSSGAAAKTESKNPPAGGKSHDQSSGQDNSASTANVTQSKRSDDQQDSKSQPTPQKEKASGEAASKKEKPQQ
ncbi:hypothetical protein C2E23DRAFT_883332 [Lenzites betulinus]|nr:hypothetical protein C2E23DRAFT_883332 [Lenzites betulinus]